MRGSIIFSATLNGTIRTIEWESGGVVGRRLARGLFPRRRLTIPHGSLIRNPEHLRNLNGFYHIPIIGNMASDL